LEAAGLRLYHAGDTIHYEGMEDALRRFDVDVAMLPINGRDAEREGRGIVGNLSEREASWLAAEVGAGVLLPMHYDAFGRNRGEPGELVHAAERDGRRVPVLVPPRELAFAWTSARPS
jgi:L-ascorbate metabolism protein UlaG (beta-lactamase superfamily)